MMTLAQRKVLVTILPLSMTAFQQLSRIHNWAGRNGEIPFTTKLAKEMNLAYEEAVDQLLTIGTVKAGEFQIVFEQLKCFRPTQTCTYDA